MAAWCTTPATISTTRCCRSARPRGCASCSAISWLEALLEALLERSGRVDHFVDEFVDDAAAHAVAAHQRIGFGLEGAARGAVDAQARVRLCVGVLRRSVGGNQQHGDMVERRGAAVRRAADGFDADVDHVAAMVIKAFHA
ncbi:hypothetical protein PT2222_80024 [Paraburkholderia tropica]